jgi:nucleoside-diphosphate-sugar epimerase
LVNIHHNNSLSFEAKISDARVEYINCDIRQPKNSVMNTPLVTIKPQFVKSRGLLWDDFFQANYIGTVNVCDWIKSIGVKNLIFTSTMTVFRAGEARNHEESLTAPDTGYGMSKLLAEWVLTVWQKAAPERRLRMVRLGVVFGRWENGNYTRLYYALKKRRFAYIGRKTTVKGLWIKNQSPPPPDSKTFPPHQHFSRTRLSEWF